MNVAAALPQIDADFFNERGLPKTYNAPPTAQMNILKKVPQNNAILISERGEEIQPIGQPDHHQIIPLQLQVQFHHQFHHQISHR